MLGVEVMSAFWPSLLKHVGTGLLQEATETAPTEEEVATAKEETLNSFVFNFASTNAQMQRVAIYSLLGLPEVHVDTSMTDHESNVCMRCP